MSGLGLVNSGWIDSILSHFKVDPGVKGIYGEILEVFCAEYSNKFGRDIQ